MASPRAVRPDGASRRSIPPSRGRRRTDQVLAGIALVMVGAFAVLAVQSYIVGPAPAASRAPSAQPTTDAANAGNSTDPGTASETPADSAPPVSPVLEGRMPTAIGDVSLTVQSAIDATSLSSGPDARALDAAIVHLGKQASDLELALAYDESGSIDLQIIGFRADGIAADQMRKAVLEAWLAAGTPGVATSTVTMSGSQATKVSYGDGGADEYVLTIGDSVFVLETTDATLAQAAAAAMLKPASPSASP